MLTPKARCCRSLPRCASCPVLLAARARGRFTRDADAHAQLVGEILAGTPPRDVPPCVRDALQRLEEARTIRA